MVNLKYIVKYSKQLVNDNQDEKFNDSWQIG